MLLEGPWLIPRYCFHSTFKLRAGRRPGNQIRGRKESPKQNKIEPLQELFLGNPRKPICSLSPERRRSSQLEATNDPSIRRRDNISPVHPIATDKKVSPFRGFILLYSPQVLLLSHFFAKQERKRNPMKVEGERTKGTRTQEARTERKWEARGLSEGR